MFAESQVDVFPDDVRAEPARHSETLVAWSGILRSASWLSDARPTARFRVEHHYWDWIQDLSIQKEWAFLSPRGEGNIRCDKSSTRSKPGDSLPPLGSMAIVYGFPQSIDGDSGDVILRCEMISFVDERYYRTDIWDYGRAYLLEGDQSDFRMLRVPF